MEETTYYLFNREPIYEEWEGKSLDAHLKALRREGGTPDAILSGSLSHVMNEYEGSTQHAIVADFLVGINRDVSTSDIGLHWVELTNLF